VSLEMQALVEIEKTIRRRIDVEWDLRSLRGDDIDIVVEGPGASADALLPRVADSPDLTESLREVTRDVFGDDELRLYSAAALEEMRNLYNRRGETIIVDDDDLNCILSELVIRVFVPHIKSEYDASFQFFSANIKSYRNPNTSHLEKLVEHIDEVIRSLDGPRLSAGIDDRAPHIKSINGGSLNKCVLKQQLDLLRQNAVFGARQPTRDCQYDINDRLDSFLVEMAGVYERITDTKKGLTELGGSEIEDPFIVLASLSLKPITSEIAVAWRKEPDNVCCVLELSQATPKALARRWQRIRRRCGWPLRPLGEDTPG
jgi:hypothetical protein